MTLRRAYTLWVTNTSHKRFNIRYYRQRKVFCLFFLKVTRVEKNASSLQKADAVLLEEGVISICASSDGRMQNAECPRIFGCVSLYVEKLTPLRVYA